MAAPSDVRIYTGTEWHSLMGPPGPTEVSADAGNIVTIGSDGKIYASASTGGDFLPLTGGTVTGPVILEGASGQAIQVLVRSPTNASLSCVGVGGSAGFSVRRFSDDNLAPTWTTRKNRGTDVAPLPLVANDQIGIWTLQASNFAGTLQNVARIIANCTATPVSGDGSTATQIQISVSSKATALARAITFNDTTFTVPVNINAQGTANTFARGSINSDALGPMLLDTFGAVMQNITAANIGRTIMATSTLDQTISIPDDAALVAPIGSVIEIIDTISGRVTIQAAAGVNLLFRAYNSATSQWALGGPAASVFMAGQNSSCRLIKTAANTWYLIGDLTAN